MGLSPSQPCFLPMASGSSPLLLLLLSGLLYLLSLPWEIIFAALNLELLPGLPLLTTLWLGFLLAHLLLLSGSTIRPTCLPAH